MIPCLQVEIGEILKNEVIRPETCRGSHPSQRDFVKIKKEGTV